MEWDRLKSEPTTFSPLKRSLSSRGPLKPNKKNRISLSLSKSRKNKDLESITNTLNTLTTASPNSSQLEQKQHPLEIKNELKTFSYCEKQEERQSQSIKMEEEELLSIPLPQLKLEETKDTKKVEEFTCTQIIKEEFSSLSLPPISASPPPIIHKHENEEKQLDEYACPICHIDLTYTKFSYLRQNHIEACISSSSSTKEEEETLEFNDCIFCAKDLSRLKQQQRQVHLNNCLDEIKPEQEIASFAGQPVPFLDTLEICPVCHEVTPFKNKSLKQKIQHTKQCAKQNRLSIVDLLKKFQWIGWGHLPVQTSNSSGTPINIPALTPAPITHQYMVANLHDDNDDDDFTRDIIIHKTNHKLTPKSTTTRKEDSEDEELQTVLALSRSMMKSKEVKKKIGIKRTDERDRNAANIWSMEESRKEANIKLDELLFSEMELNHLYLQSEREKSIGYLNESRLASSIPSFYWNLASNQDRNWDKDPLIFVSLFMRK